MIDIMYLTQYAQRRVILEALTRAGNRQAQVVANANDTDHSDARRRDVLDAELAKYYALLEAVNQAQLACDRALLVIARAVVASDTPFADVTSMLNESAINSSPNTALAIDIVRELQAITQEAR